MVAFDSAFDTRVVYGAVMKLAYIVFGSLQVDTTADILQLFFGQLFFNCIGMPPDLFTNILNRTYDEKSINFQIYFIFIQSLYIEAPSATYE